MRPRLRGPQARRRLEAAASGCGDSAASGCLATGHGRVGLRANASARTRLRFRADQRGLASSGSSCRSRWTPRPRIVAAMMAFGGGAFSPPSPSTGRRGPPDERLLPARVRMPDRRCPVRRAEPDREREGGFLRNAANTVRYLTKVKSEHVRSLAERLCDVPLFASYAQRHRRPPPRGSRATYRAGTTIIRQGEPGDSFFVIEHGEVDVIDEKAVERRSDRSEPTTSSVKWRCSQVSRGPRQRCLSKTLRCGSS